MNLLQKNCVHSLLSALKHLNDITVSDSLNYCNS